MMPGVAAQAQRTKVAAAVAQAATFTETQAPNTLTNSNRTWTCTTTGTTTWEKVNTRVGFLKQTGKWYAEVTVTSAPGAGVMIGIAPSTVGLGTSEAAGTTGRLQYFSDGRKRSNGNYAAYGAAFTTGDVIGVALDMDNRTVTFYKNGVSQGQAFGPNASNTIGIAPSINYILHCCNLGSPSPAVLTMAATLAYPVPAGFLPW